MHGIDKSLIFGNNKTYVYNNTEVRLTGRTADRQLQGVGRRSTSVIIDTVHEITPVDPEAGTWKQWVRIIDLYEVK